MLFVLVSAAGLIKLLIELARKNFDSAKECIPFVLTLPSLALFAIAATGINALYNNLHKGAVFTAVERGNERKLERSLARGADINQVKTFTVNYRRCSCTPLAYACYMDKTNVAELLIARGEDVNKTADAKGSTPLMYACQNNNFALAELLIARGAEINKRTSSQSCFYLALRYGDLPLIRLLWENGADTDTAALEYKDTPIFILTEYNPRLDILDFLITQKIDTDINYISHSGKTAFMRSIEQGNPNDYTSALYAHGATADIVNEFGKTAVDYAREKENKEMIRFLEKLEGKKEAADKTSY